MKHFQWKPLAFFAALSQHTLLTSKICPEVSQLFSFEAEDLAAEKVNGELHFYLNGALHWGVELLVDGSGAGEHIARFENGGKYAPLQMEDYIVLDCRPGPVSEVTRHRNRLTFESCCCVYVYRNGPDFQL